MNDKLARFSSVLRDKKSLMFCIFMTLLFQIIVTSLTVKVDQAHQIIDKQSWWVMGLFFIIMIAVILLLSIEAIPFHFKQLLFVIFSIIQGLLLSQLVHAIKDPEIIDTAAIATIVNFVIMLIFGFIIVYMGIDLGWMGIYLLMGLMVLLTASIIYMFSEKSKNRNKGFAGVTVLLFSIFILYDTNNILFKYENTSTNCIRGAMDYYMDILNLFASYLDL